MRPVTFPGYRRGLTKTSPNPERGFNFGAGGARRNAFQDMSMCVVAAGFGGLGNKILLISFVKPAKQTGADGFGRLRAR